MPISISGDGSIGSLSATEIGYLDGVTSAVQTQINGKLTTPGVWTSYTPTITPETGTFTTVTVDRSKYLQIGKLVIVSLDIKITTIGTASGSMRVTLPVTAISTYCGFGTARETDVAGTLGQFYNDTTDRITLLTFNNGASVIANYRWRGGYHYEAA